MHNKIPEIIKFGKVQARKGINYLGLGTKPNFIIIGAQKAGTTSLYNYINTYAKNFHPPVKKEIHYFDQNYNKSTNWYIAQFPIFKDGITGEASPYYMFHPQCPERIYNFSEDIKFIVLLRNPVERAYSHYHFLNSKNKHNAYDPLSFEKAIKIESERLKGEEEKIIANNYYCSPAHKHYSYLSRGLYYKQLKKWFQFFPRNQFLILKSEDLFKHPENILKNCFSFLDLEFKDNIQFSFKKYNKNESKMAINEDTEKYLAEYFKPHNKKLYDLLGEDFGWDK